MNKVWNSLIYTDSDHALLRRMFDEYYSYRDIGIALHRTKTSVAQQVRRLGLHRNHLLVRVVTHYGPEALEVSGDRAALKALGKAQRRERTNRIRAARDQDKRAVLAKLKVDIAAGADYNRTLKAAYKDGKVSIKAIADTLGVTHWHVQTRVAPFKRSRDQQGW